MIKKRLFSICVVALILLAGAGCITVVDPSQDAKRDKASQPVISSGYNVPIDAGWQAPAVSQSRTALPDGIPAIVKRISKSVVAVHTEANAYDIFLQPVPEQGVGTGVIIDTRGYILTNSHVVENARTVKVILNNGKSVDALKVNHDSWTDLAVIQIPPDGLSPVELGSSQDQEVGESIIAVGNALALEGGPTVTAGIVSYLGRSIIIGNDIVLHDLIQTDAAINPGNSGGPLLNMKGKVVRINSAVAAGGQNIGFAIAMSSALFVVEKLVQQGYVFGPWLGIQLYTVEGGVMVIGIDKGSPAEKAGLLPDDVIKTYNGKTALTVHGLCEMINASQIGQTVEIVYVRKGKQLEIAMTLEKNPPD